MAEENRTTASNGSGTAGQKAFAIRRIYTKDISFESPNAPQIFNEEKWNPEVNISLQNQALALGPELHEVTIATTITVKLGERTAYLVEVQQAGEFQTTGFDGNELRELLGIFCPTLLYPFLREAVAGLISKGGFPPLLLAPVNFDALYHQHQKNLQEQQSRQQPSADA
jgi:preprotein translocase subunit SecB